MFHTMSVTPQSLNMRFTATTRTTDAAVRTGGALDSTMPRGPTLERDPRNGATRHAARRRRRGARYLKKPRLAGRVIIVIIIIMIVVAIILVIILVILVMINIIIILIIA